MREFLKSKKVKAMLVGLIVIALPAALKPLGVELTPEHMVTITGAVTVIVGAYIHSQGNVDKAEKGGDGGTP